MRIEVDLAASIDSGNLERLNPKRYLDAVAHAIRELFPEHYFDFWLNDSVGKARIEMEREDADLRAELEIEISAADARDGAISDYQGGK